MESRYTHDPEIYSNLLQRVVNFLIEGCLPVAITLSNNLEKPPYLPPQAVYPFVELDYSLKVVL